MAEITGSVCSGTQPLVTTADGKVNVKATYVDRNV